MCVLFPYIVVRSPVACPCTFLYRLQSCSRIIPLDYIEEGTRDQTPRLYHTGTCNLDLHQVIATNIPVILDSIVVSIPACHAGDRGSIPRRGDNILQVQTLSSLFWMKIAYMNDFLATNSAAGCNLPHRLKTRCIGRESNPGRPRGRRAFYHWTTDANTLSRGPDFVVFWGTVRHIIDNLYSIPVFFLCNPWITMDLLSLYCDLCLFCINHYV